MVMRYLLDSNILIFVIKDPECPAASRLKQIDVADVAICSVVESELYHGAKKYGNPAKRSAVLDELLAPYTSLPFDTACVPHYAAVRDSLERQGRIIGGNDLMIAAIALTHDLTVVTNNCQEFGRVSGLGWKTGRSNPVPCCQQVSDFVGCLKMSEDSRMPDQLLPQPPAGRSGMAKPRI